MLILILLTHHILKRSHHRACVLEQYTFMSLLSKISDFFFFNQSVEWGIIKEL